MDEYPLIRVVILNFDGGSMTLDCCDSVLAMRWPEQKLDVVLVDNGSLDDVVSVVSTNPSYQRIRVLEPLRNLGFAGGCNLGIRDPGGPGRPEFVALINNDATVDSDWLIEMMKGFGGQSPEVSRIGAVAAKMMMHHQVYPIRVMVDATARDSVESGVRLVAARIDGVQHDERIIADEGFVLHGSPEVELGEETSIRCRSLGHLYITDDPQTRPQRVSLKLVSDGSRATRLQSAVDEIEIAITPEPAWFDVQLGPDAVDLINNAGSELYERGYAGDRGFLQIDRGQFEESVEVFAWCGGAVLLATTYLDDVGHFDDRFFLYYEDTDLSWRGRLQGWRYIYAPRALVRHRHAQSAGVGSEIFRFHTVRNHLLVLAKNAPISLLWGPLIGLLRQLARRVVADLILRPLRLQMPSRTEVRRQAQVLKSFINLLPSMLRERWSHVPQVPRREVAKWMTTKVWSI